MRRPQPPRYAPGLFRGSVAAFLVVTAWTARMGPVGKHLYAFGGLYAAAFAVLAVLIRTFPSHWPWKRQLILVLALSAAARALFLPFPPSTDVNRYIWEGILLNHGINPYSHPPSDPSLESLARDREALWSPINHKDASACYPPLAMLLFGLAARLSPTLVFFKIVVVAFDLAAVWILIRLLRAYDFPLNRALLYALNPLVLVFIAGEGHMDSLQVFFLLWSFLLFRRRRDGAGFFLLGCAVASKYLAAVAFPFWIRADNRKKVPWLFIAMAVCYLPFRGTGSALFDSLIPFGTVMHYNDSLTALLRPWLGEGTAWAGLALLTTACGAIFLAVHDPLKSSGMAAGCLLLLLGTLHPWYLTLVTPFLAFFPSRAWLLLHAGVLFTFPVLHHEYASGRFQEIHWLKLLEYIPFYGILLWDAWRGTPYFDDPAHAPVRSLSVVIPTLDEASNIGSCMECMQGDPAVGEIIVADGGSRDETLETAWNLGARVVRTSRGRGLQIREGMNLARGEGVWIVHADCRPLPRAASRIVEALNQAPQCVGGALGMEFRPSSGRTRLVQWLNNARARWTGIAFGDQGQFFRKKALEAREGFPPLMLMEDVELSMKLKESGPVRFLPRGVFVSRRRWTRQGFLANFLRVIHLSLSYLVKRRLGTADEAGRDFYHRYYRK